MGAFRYPGSMCQTLDWYQDLEDGTLVRAISPLPSVTGATAPSAPVQRRRRIVAKGGCAFLNPQSRGTVKAPQEAFDRLRRGSPAAKISEPSAKASQVWPDGSTSTALEAAIQVGSHEIKILLPTEDRARGRNLPTLRQLAEALRSVPSVQLEETFLITLSPTAATGTVQAGETIAGEAGDGKVILYPVQERQTQLDFDIRVTHECGHNYAQKVWVKGTGIAAWLAVIAADDLRPSPYAAADGEDFPEFVVLYNAAKGTACEATAKQLYPNRWNKMDSYTS